LTLEARIERRLRRHLRSLGFEKSAGDGVLSFPTGGKDVLRSMHLARRRDALADAREFITRRAPELLIHFASGGDVDPPGVLPALQIIQAGTVESDLFRLASLTWSVPVSQGYGRRMRFLVWDQRNGKLIGILALGDPVFNLQTRDRLIGWSARQRMENLVFMMDAYVLGALPPYNSLLGGKLVACLVRTREIRAAFAERYGDSRGLLSKRKKHASLVMVTTSSALGRSSLYNRLTLNGTPFFERIGYTSGWGHFHIPNDLFDEMRIYLARQKHSYADGHRFGSGPNWRLRAIRTTLSLIGMNPDLLRHGVGREVFACRFAANAERVLRGERVRPYCRHLCSVEEVGRLAVKRWVAPRAERRPAFRSWDRSQILDLLDRTVVGRPSVAELALSASQSTSRDCE
jgi:hypothetical protein